MMEGIFSKIPDLGEKIFKEIDAQSLVTCKEVQRSWCNFINGEKVIWFRMIQKCIGNDNKFITVWRKVLTKAPVDFVIKVALTTRQCEANNEIQFPISPIHLATRVGSVDLYKQMMVKLVDMNPKNIFGNNHPIFLAAAGGQFDIYKHMFWELGGKNPTMQNVMGSFVVFIQLVQKSNQQQI